MYGFIECEYCGVLAKIMTTSTSAKREWVVGKSFVSRVFPKGYSNLTETIWETPRSCMVTP